MHNSQLAFSTICRSDSPIFSYFRVDRLTSRVRYHKGNMTLFKRLTLGLIALILIVAVVGAIVISRLDLNHHKDRIEALVFEKTGRQLQINGQINASIFPWIGLSLTDVTLANSEEFSGSDFASVVSSELQVDVLPLLMGRVNVQTVELHGLSLKLQRDADGKTNWDDLMATTAVVETNAGDDILQEVEAGAPVVAALSIGGLQITNATILFSDARADSYISLKDLNLNTGTIVLAQPFDFESDFSVITGAANGLKSKVSATGAIKLNLADNVYQLERLNLNTVSAGRALPMDQLPLSIVGDLVADLNKQTVDLIIEEGHALGIPISGEFHATGMQSEPHLTGRLNSGEFNAASVVDQLGITLSPQFDPALLDRASVSARFEQQNDQLVVDSINASLGDLQVSGQLQVTNLSTAGVLVGQFESTEFNPAPWLESIGLVASDENAMHSAQFSTAVRQSGQLLSFNQLVLQLDESQFDGVVEVTDIKATNPPINFALAVDQINLDRYLPAANDAEATDTVAKAGLTGDDSLLPVQPLRKLNLVGDVTAGQVTLARVTAQNVVLPVLANNGKIEIKEAKAELYSGAFFSTVSLDVNSDEPLLTVAANLNGLNAEPFLQDYLAAESPLTGIANINVDLLSRGNTSQQLIEGANGALSTRFTDGRVKGIDIASELRRAQRLLSGQSSDASPESVSTEFSELSAAAVIADGVLQSDDLIFTSPLLRLSGQGGINLVSQSVDYLLHILLTDSEQVQQDDALSELAGMELSVPVRGQFNDLSIDFKALLLNAFDSNLIEQLKARKEQWLNQQKADVASKIESEKAALQERLEKERETAAALMIEKKQQAQAEVEKQKRELQERIEAEKEALTDKLEDNLKKGLGDLLGVD